MMCSFFLGRPSRRGDFFVGGRSAELVLKLDRGLPPLGQQLHHVGRDANRLGRVHQRALDRLLDPVDGVGAEAGVHRGVEALDGAEQAEVAFFDQVLQAEALAGVGAGDVDDEAEIGADHVIAGHVVAGRNRLGEPLFLLRAEQRRAVDLGQVRVQRRLERVVLFTAWSCHGRQMSWANLWPTLCRRGRASAPFSHYKRSEDGCKQWTCVSTTRIRCTDRKRTANSARSAKLSPT